MTSVMWVLEVTWYITLHRAHLFYHYSWVTTEDWSAGFTFPPFSFSCLAAYTCIRLGEACPVWFIVLNGYLTLRTTSTVVVGFVLNWMILARREAVPSDFTGWVAPLENIQADFTATRCLLSSEMEVGNGSPLVVCYATVIL